MFEEKVNARMDKLMHGWTDGRTDTWTDDRQRTITEAHWPMASRATNNVLYPLKELQSICDNFEDVCLSF